MRTCVLLQWDSGEVDRVLRWVMALRVGEELQQAGPLPLFFSVWPGLARVLPPMAMAFCGAPCGMGVKHCGAGLGVCGDPWQAATKKSVSYDRVGDG